MARNLKTLGLSLVAVFAMSALVASAAQAAAHFGWEAGAKKFTTTNDPTAGAGGNQVITLTKSGLSFTCNEIKGEGNLEGAENKSTTWTTTSITYNHTEAGSGNEDKCKGPLGTTPKIEMNGCNKKLEATETTVPGDTSQITADMYIVCPAGKTIVFNSGGLCTVTIGSQGPLKHVILTNANTTGKEEVTGHATITEEIVESHSGLCGSATNLKDGSYTGKFTVIAHDNGTPPVQKNLTVT